jgi:IS605 OrfB family transposase
MILTYKYRLKDGHAKVRLHSWAWAINQVWNYCVETQRKVQLMRQQGASCSWPSNFDLSRLTTGTSKDLMVNSKSIVEACTQFTRSRDRSKKCPRFRASSGSKRALGWIPFPQDGYRVRGNSVVYLKHHFRFFGTNCRPIPSVVKDGCFVEDAQGKWWVCFHVEVGTLSAGTGEVGIDLGLKTLATTSAGEKIENPNAFRQLEAKLATAQRAGNRKLTKAIYRKISNIRKDHLHKTSAKLADANRLIVVGNVNAASLAKTRMAKSVLDAGWSMFRNMLAYKARRHQATFLEVDEKFTTQTCSTCGLIHKSRPKGIAGLGIREWVCSDCGANHDRDVNAAKNILRLGQGVLPRVDESQLS